MRREKNWRCIEYWLSKNYTEAEAKILISQKQKESNYFCVEYWIKRGCTEKEALLEIEKKKAEFKERVNEPDHRKKLSTAQKNLHKKEYWIEKWGDEGENKFIEFKQANFKNLSEGQKQFQLKIKENPSGFREYNRLCVEYWTKKGYDEESAKNQISKIQKRDLLYFVEKYGESDGYEKWKHKINTWQSSISKQKEEINEKQRKNSHCGYYTEELLKRKNIDFLNFYLLEFEDDKGKFYKFGITKRNKIHKRWKACLDYKVLFFNKKKAIEALKKENEIKNLIKCGRLQTRETSLIKSKEIIDESEKDILFKILKEEFREKAHNDLSEFI